MFSSTIDISSKRMGIFELTAAMMVSGTIGVFVVESGADPFTVAFFRCVFGAAALALYCLFRGFFRDTGFTRKTLLLAMVGGVFLVFNWAFLFMSYGETSIAVATVIYHTQPFYVVLLGILVFRDRITRSKVGWIFVAFAGFLLVTDLSNLASGSGYALGVIYALLAAVLYAFATIIAKKLKGIRPHVIALVQVLVGIPLLLPFANFASTAGIGAGWAWLIGIGIFHTCLQYILMYSSYQKLPTPLIAVLSFIYPAMAIVVDMFVYGTVISMFQVLGIGMIVLASLANSLNWDIPGLQPANRTGDTTDDEPRAAHQAEPKQPAGDR